MERNIYSWMREIRTTNNGITKYLSALLIGIFVSMPLSVFAQEVDNITLDSSSTTIIISETDSSESTTTNLDSIFDAPLLPNTENPLLDNESQSSTPNINTQESTSESDVGENNSSEEVIPDDEGFSYSMMDDPNVEVTTPETNSFTSNSTLPKNDQNTGALSQRIQLDLPPGRLGLQPELALEYSSQNTEDGIFGYGWNVSIPYIERFNKTGTENLYSGNTFVSSFGGELLNTSTSSPTEFRHKTEDGSFIKYTFTNDVWIAYDKNGTRYTFGTTSQSRKFATTTPSQIHKWMVEEIRDTNDNFIRFEYERENNELYPYKIFYTGHGSTDGVVVVEFVRSSRNDAIISYKTGFKVVTEKIITSVEVDVSSSWVRKYQLGYTVGSNGKRSLLYSIIKTGRDGMSSELTLPPITFSYVSSTTPFAKESSPSVKNNAHIVADVEGNAINEVSVFYTDTNNSSKNGVINNSSIGTVVETWARNTNGPESYAPNRNGVRFFDVNGDSKADIVHGYRAYDATTTEKIYINNYATSTGYSWSLASTTGVVPIFDYTTDNQSYTLNTGLLGNINGDGLVDYVASLDTFATSTYIGNGMGWTATSTFDGPMFVPGVNGHPAANSQLVDINGDGLDDWVYSDDTNTYVRINNGLGWESLPDSRWTIATSTIYKSSFTAYDAYWDRGIRFIDINGDGLTDFVRAYSVPPYSATGDGVPDIEIADVKFVYLNTGSGWATSTSFASALPAYITVGNHNGVTWHGDIRYNEYVSKYGNGQKEQDVMLTIYFATGGNAQIEYSNTAMTGNHPELPMSLLTVKKITVNDNNGKNKVNDYAYYGGKISAPTIRDRKFAGFASTTEATANTLKISYFNQGDSLHVGNSEQTDSDFQIKKLYRQDTFDTSSSTLLKRVFNRWETFEQENDRAFVYLSKKLEQDYDASTHKDTATEYLYSTTTGEVLEIDSLGEVSGSSDGTYTDAGYDNFTKTIAYTTNASSTLVVPTNETFTNASSTKVKEKIYIYDGLSFGSVTLGNITQEKDWISSSNYASTTRSVGSYGLPTNQTDAFGNSTIFVYDSNNMYVATSTNPLGHETAFLNDYASGLVTRSVDANGVVLLNTLDPLGRLTERKVSDPNSPSSQVAITQITYNDATSSLYTLTKTLLSSATSTDLYTYFNGLGKPIQQRKTAEGSNTYTVIDVIYNNQGQSELESLPYFASSTSKSTATTTSSLYTYKKYDSLDRLISVGNSVGTTTYTYSPWQTRITDPRGNNKDLIYDGYGRLAQVKEYDGGNMFPTYYSYDVLGNLTRITDAGTAMNSNTHSSQFSSSGQYLYRADEPEFDLGGSLTVMAWVKIDLNSANTYDRWIIHKYSSGSGYYLALSNGGYLFGGVNSASVGNQTGYADNVYVSSQIDDGEWHHISLTYNGTTLKLYIDNTLVADEASSSQNTDNNYDLVISRNHATDYYSGLIDGIRLYNTALTLQQISDVRSLETAGSVSGVTTVYNLNNAYVDSSGNGNTLTATGTPTFSADVPFMTSYSSTGNIRNFAYDGMSRRVSAEDLHATDDASFGAWSYAYDVNGNLESYTDPKSQTVNYTYDSLNRTLTENYTGSAGTEVVYTHDTCSYGKGRLCIASTTSSYKMNNYNTLGLLSNESILVDGDMSTTTYAYDRQGNVTSIVYPDNRTVNYAMNIGGQVDSVSTKASGESVFTPVITNLTYAPTNQAALKEYQNGLKTTYVYDSSNLYRLNRLYTGTTTPSFVLSDPNYNTHSTSLTRSSSQYWSISDGSQTGLDLNGTWTISIWVKIGTAPTSGQNYGLVSKCDAAQNSFELVYANEGGTKKIKIYNEDGSTGVDSYYNVDLGTGTWHHIVAVRTPSSVAHFWIDGVDHAGTGTLQATTRNGSNPFQVGTGGLSGANNDKFDGLIDDVRVWTRAITSQEISDLYTDAGSFDNGSDLQGWWKFDNDSDDDTANTNDLTGTNSPTFSTDVPFGEYPGGADVNIPGVQDINYTYDENGNITEIEENSNTYVNRTTLFTYDDLNRLTVASTTSATSTPYRQTFTYDSIGNMVYKSDIGSYTYGTSTYANPHAPYTVNGVTYTYDNNGNLTTDGVFNHTWNYRNRLTSSGNGTATSTYTYDHTDSRILKGTGIATSTYISKLYDTFQTFTASTTATTTSYIWLGDSIVATIQTATSTPVIRYTHTDHLGSGNILTDSSGAVLQALDYYPYGEERIDEGNDLSQRTYVGIYSDSDTELLYANARYYNGSTGQFLSQDPVFWELPADILADPQQINSYSYSRNNPIIGKDTDGRRVELVSRAVQFSGWQSILNGWFGHSFLLITPENSSTIGEVDGVNTQNAFTLGATIDNGQLVKSPNGDIQYANGCDSCASVLVSPPDGVTQEQFEQNIVSDYNSMLHVLDKNYGEILGEGVLRGNPNSNNAATTFLMNADIGRGEVNKYQTQLYLQNNLNTPGLGTPINGSLRSQTFIQFNNLVSSLKELVGSLKNRNSSN